MHTNDHFLLPRCTGMNCGATDANHSPECRAEHAAAIAGGRFVKDAALSARADGGKGEAVSDGAQNFACYLIDHCEGETVREESILTWLGKMLSDPQYTAQQAECAPRVDDLSALVARLARALRKAAPENDLSGKALDYLKREGLEGSPLRAECAPREAQPVACPNCGGGPVTWKCMCEPMWRPTPERADADTAGAKLLGPADEGFWSKPNSAAGASERADAEKDAALTDEQIVENWLTKMGLWDSAFVCQDQKDTLAAFCSYARAILAAIKNKEKKS